MLTVYKLSSFTDQFRISLMNVLIVIVRWTFLLYGFFNEFLQCGYYTSKEHLLIKNYMRIINPYFFSISPTSCYFESGVYVPLG